MNINTSRPESRSMAAINRCSIAFWNAMRVSWTTVARYSSIIVFYIGSDATEQTDEHLVVEQQRLGTHRPGWQERL